MDRSPSCRRSSRLNADPGPSCGWDRKPRCRLVPQFSLCREPEAIFDPVCERKSRFARSRLEPGFLMRLSAQVDPIGLSGLTLRGPAEWPFLVHAEMYSRKARSSMALRLQRLQEIAFGPEAAARADRPISIGSARNQDAAGRIERRRYRPADGDRQIVGSADHGSGRPVR